MFTLLNNCSTIYTKVAIIILISFLHASYIHILKIFQRLTKNHFASQFQFRIIKSKGPINSIRIKQVTILTNTFNFKPINIKRFSYSKGRGRSYKEP